MFFDPESNLDCIELTVVWIKKKTIYMQHVISIFGQYKTRFCSKTNVLKFRETLKKVIFWRFSSLDLFVPPSFASKKTGNALRVSRAVTRLTVYRPLQVDGVKNVTIVLNALNFPKNFRMCSISHANNQLFGYDSSGELWPTSWSYLKRAVNRQHGYRPGDS